MIHQIDQVYDFLLSINDGTLESYRKNCPETWLLNLAIDAAPLDPKQRIVCLFLAGDETQCRNSLERKLIQQQCGQSTLKQLVEEWSTQPINHTTLPHSNIIRGSLTQPNLKIALKSLYSLYMIDHLRPVPTQLTTKPQWCDGFCADTLWDYTIELSQDPLVRIKEYLHKAQTTKLSQHEALETIEILNQDQKWVIESGLTPQKFPLLIEYNPDLSSFLLARINQCGLSIHEYFECLIQMKISLQSLEVVNKLSNSIKLPEAFLNMYLQKCIENCEELKPKPQMQSRYVRLVAVFIKTLIKSKTFDPKKMFQELQAFCIDFSKIPEASHLFKQLKETTNDDNKQHS